MKRKLIYIVFDIFILIFTFLLFVWSKPASVRVYLPKHIGLFFFFLTIWILVSILFGKYNFEKRNNYILSLSPIIRSNFIILALVSLLLVLYQDLQYSRMIFFGTYATSFMAEIIITLIFFYNKQLTFEADKQEAYRKELLYDQKPAAKTEDRSVNLLTDNEEVSRIIESVLEKGLDEEAIKLVVAQNRELIVREANEKVYELVCQHTNCKSLKNLIFQTTTAFNIEKQPFSNYDSVLNLHRINDIRRINKFFETVNRKLKTGGIFIASVETKNLRKKRIFRKYPIGFNGLFYFFDFLYKRVMPKMPMFKRIYFFFNRGNNRVLSEQEVFGRLYSCGFKLNEEKLIDGLLYFVAEKVKDPVYDFNPSYGPLFKMKRKGKGGKTIYVYKFRTMYPYSEYLQEYVYEKFSLQEGGKFKDDYRITTAGKFMRKFWIDELPMFINFFRGELKLVGVRPLSSHYFSLYTPEMQERRLNYKPGLIPPFYMDMPKTFEEILASEKKYMDAFDKHPFWTDIRYFLSAFYNIVFKRARSN
jgi:lipopolysaccharide/colanic/teichoic acid biosynthesis glycosyltransferase